MDSIIRKLKKLGIEVIYTDTDSIICNKPIPKDLISSEEIGKFKEEYVDKKIERIRIIAPKAYELKFSDGTNLIKFKGVESKTLNSEDIEKLYRGEEIKIKNHRFFIDSFKNVTSNDTILKIKRSNNKNNIVYNDDGTWKSIRPWIIPTDTEGSD